MSIVRNGSPNIAAANMISIMSLSFIFILLFKNPCSIILTFRVKYTIMKRYLLKEGIK